MNRNDTLAMTIKNKILLKFPYADIDITLDKEQNEYFISTSDEELYHSEAYGVLVMDIKLNILWKQNVYNFYFILDLRKSEFGKMTKNMTFSPANEINYKTWDVNKTPFVTNKLIEIADSSLAA